MALRLWALLITVFDPIEPNNMLTSNVYHATGTMTSPEQLLADAFVVLAPEESESILVTAWAAGLVPGPIPLSLLKVSLSERQPVPPTVGPDDDFCPEDETSEGDES